MNRAGVVLLTAAAALAVPGAAAQAGEAEAFQALRMLFSAAATPVDRKPGCEGRLPGVRRVTLGDLLASRLSVFQMGTNSVDGLCESGHCRVTLNHMDGEDVSSLTVHFVSAHGKAVPSSIRCEMTP